MAEPLQSKVIIIPRGFTESQRESMGRDIISKIKQRTSQGIDVNGSLFGPYSKNYDKTGTVNLRVTGDMLAGLTVLATGDGFIRIGFDSGRANSKAAWIQAPYGQKVGKQPPRQFVGISQDDLNIIVERYR